MSLLDTFDDADLHATFLDVDRPSLEETPAGDGCFFLDEAAFAEGPPVAEADVGPVEVAAQADVAEVPRAEKRGRKRGSTVLALAARRVVVAKANAKAAAAAPPMTRAEAGKRGALARWRHPRDAAAELPSTQASEASVAGTQIMVYTPPPANQVLYTAETHALVVAPMVAEADARKKEFEKELSLATTSHNMSAKAQGDQLRLEQLIQCIQ